MDQLQPCTYYHIFNHANGDEALFREPENYRYFLQQYYKHINGIADTYAYCLMRNHFHLLVRLETAEAITAHLPGFKNLAGVAASNLLSKQFSNFFNGYSKAFNKKYERRGSLFLENFTKKAILQKDYLAAVILYIHLNQVKHGFTQHPAHWNVSSFHNFHVERLPVLKALYENSENYFRLHEGKINSYAEYDNLERYLLN
ncbi:transposase [Ginsengibacter hankyongi]|uniref:Transposase n=1 Tax=Ginsengibacter hankyongi TaxID=2607284 RepID=A0A5J5IG02_9BACT|nr:transposase [Ginsengibacter hankyongi]KAA9038729.1 transposase [Ginsengibacter hankyongi]